MKRGRASRGFTLVELLVALFAMALLAVMSWRGLDGMSRAQAQTEARSDEVLTLQVGLAQWAADLDALLELPQTTALDWNGRVLRMTRRGTGGGDRRSAGGGLDPAGGRRHRHLAALAVAADHDARRAGTGLAAGGQLVAQSG